MRRKKIFKKIIIALLVLLACILAVFVLPVLIRLCRAFYAENEGGDVEFFDSQVRQIIRKVDRTMSREGYAINEKTVESEDILPYNGVNMRFVKVRNSYSRQMQVVSHEKTAYQRAIGWLEGKIGRLPGLLYALDLVKYEGERKEMRQDATVECRFILIEDKKSRFLGGDYYAYSGTMERSELTSYAVLGEKGELLGEYSQSAVKTGKHFDGDLGWLKSKAYNNYVSPIIVVDAFEWYE